MGRSCTRIVWPLWIEISSMMDPVISVTPLCTTRRRAVASGMESPLS